MDEQVNIPALVTMPMESRIAGFRALSGYARREAQPGLQANP